MNLKAFNNLMVWRLVEPLDVDPAGMNEALAQHESQPPAAGEAERTGFIEPLGDKGLFVETVAPGVELVAINTAKRMLPGKIVRRAVDGKVFEIEKNEARKVYAREKQRIKEDVLAEMLPRAFVDHSQVYALLIGDYIFIGNSSAKRGEALLDALRGVLGSVKVVPVSVTPTPIRKYTRWFVKGEVEGSDKFTLGSQFVVHGTASEREAVKGSWPFSNDETLSDWIAQGGQDVTAIGMIWTSEGMESEVPFLVNEMLGVKGIKWPAAIVDRAVSDAGEDAEDRQVARATLLLLSHEITALWQDLLAALGGEALPQGHQAAVDEDDDLL